MAYAIKCKTCSKISKQNYTYRSTAILKIVNRQVLKECSEANHKIYVEKVY